VTLYKAIEFYLTSLCQFVYWVQTLISTFREHSAIIRWWRNMHLSQSVYLLRWMIIRCNSLFMAHKQLKSQKATIEITMAQLFPEAGNLYSVTGMSLSRAHQCRCKLRWDYTHAYNWPVALLILSANVHGTKERKKAVTNNFRKVCILLPQSVNKILYFGKGTW